MVQYEPSLWRYSRHCINVESDYTDNHHVNMVQYEPSLWRYNRHCNSLEWTQEREPAPTG